MDGDPLTSLLFEPVDATAAWFSGIPGSVGPDLAPRDGTAGSVAGGLVARSAMPTYGKLAQSVGGAAAFGQLDPRAAWGELLAELQGFAREAGPNSQAAVLISELLADWRVPVEEGPEGISRWLRSAVDQAATPLEAKLTRAAVNPSAERETAVTPGQDVRAPGSDRAGDARGRAW